MPSRTSPIPSAATLYPLRSVCSLDCSLLGNAVMLRPVDTKWLTAPGNYHSPVSALYHTRLNSLRALISQSDYLCVAQKNLNINQLFNYTEVDTSIANYNFIFFIESSGCHWYFVFRWTWVRLALPVVECPYRNYALLPLVCQSKCCHCTLKQITDPFFHTFSVSNSALINVRSLRE